MDENANNISISSTLDSSFGTISINATATSTPRRGKRKQDPKPFVFKQPVRPPPKVTKVVHNVLRRRKQAQKEKIGCRICGKEYVVASALKNHKRLHAIEAAAEKFPNRAKIINNLPDIVESTLKKICASTLPCAVTEYASDFIQLNRGTNSFQEFTEMLFESFMCAVSSKKFLLPSKLLEALVMKCDSLLSDLTLRSELIFLLSLSRVNCDEEVLQLFLCKFIISFSEELLKFISVNVCEVSTGKKNYECDDDDRQTLHFIGGAILRGFYKKAKRYPSSKLWQSLKETIAHRMVESDKIEGTSSEDKSWTNARNRGNLIQVSDDCLEFLVCLAEIIENSEEADGSLSYLTVYEKVCNSMAMTVYWDNMISQCLPDNISTIFLRAFTKAFCQTYGRGITKRRMNTMNAVPVQSINLRHQVARKVKVK